MAELSRGVRLALDRIEAAAPLMTDGEARGLASFAELMVSVPLPAEERDQLGDRFALQLALLSEAARKLRN
jgi:hypothetical protein